MALTAIGPGRSPSQLWQAPSPHFSPPIYSGRRCTAPSGVFSPRGARRTVEYASAPLGSKPPPATTSRHPRDEIR